MAFLFEKLDAYQRALDFTMTVENLCNELPRGKYFMADQLRRASLSISLNIAEGNGRWHKAEKRHFFTIARGSACECVPIIELLRRGDLIETEICDKLKTDIEALCQMITGLINKSENR